MNVPRIRAVFGNMNLRDKLLLLMAVIFIGFATSIIMGILVINKVRIESAAYGEIKMNQQGLERIAILGSSLNRFRVMTSILITVQGSDRRGQIEAAIAGLRSEIDAKFQELETIIGKGGQASALLDARDTWADFSKTVEEQILPAVRRGDRSAAMDLQQSVQEQRYERFIEQIDALVQSHSGHSCVRWNDRQGLPFQICIYPQTAGQAQERQDCVLIADLLEYEILPLVPEWKALFAVLQQITTKEK